MSLTELTVRRANVDDVKPLLLLWERAGLPGLELEKRLMEFQVAVDAEGNLLAALGLHISGKNGKLHSEAFLEPQHEEQLRPKLWERMVSVGKNHGLFRMWTLEDAPFWHQAGFKPASEEWLKKTPAGFGAPQAAWHLLHLREESVEAISVEKEFEMFQRQQWEATDAMYRQAKFFKVLAWIVSILFAIFVVMVIFKAVTGNLPVLPRRP